MLMTKPLEQEVYWLKAWKNMHNIFLPSISYIYLVKPDLVFDKIHKAAVFHLLSEATSLHSAAFKSANSWLPLLGR